MILLPDLYFHYLACVMVDSLDKTCLFDFREFGLLSYV